MLHSFDGLRWTHQIGLLLMYGSSQLSWYSNKALSQRLWVRITLQPREFFLG